MNPLETPFISRMRRSHALEHATMHILARRHPNLRLMGRTALEGFYLYGMVETEEVASAAEEALARLQAGESELAIHPQCGTNLVVSGILAGLFSLAATRGRKESLLGKLPRVILAATMATILAQPLGPLLQKYVTTSSEMEGVSIERIIRWGRGLHQVKLSFQ